MPATRCKRNPDNRTATLSGVRFRELLQVLTGAYIHFSDSVIKARRDLDRNPGNEHAQEELAYAQAMEREIKLLEAAIKHHDSDETCYCDACNSERQDFQGVAKGTKKERLTKVTERKMEREFIDRVLVDSLKEIAAARKAKKASKK